jgi:hypothetical protein
MALVEIARFLDITEAQAAASALRASGIPVFMQNENWGQTEAYLQIGMGGFRLWTPEEDADDARAFIAESQGPPALVAEIAVVTLGAIVLAGVAGFFGWMLAPLLKRHRVLADHDLPADDGIPQADG